MDVIPVSQPPVHSLAPSKGLLEEDFSTQIQRNNVDVAPFIEGFLDLPHPNILADKLRRSVIVSQQQWTVVVISGAMCSQAFSVIIVICRLLLAKYFFSSSVPFPIVNSKCKVLQTTDMLFRVLKKILSSTFSRFKVVLLLTTPFSPTTMSVMDRISK